MLIHVYDENFKKVGILKKYTFAQYIDKLNDIGTFEILAEFCKENTFLLNKERQYFVSFDSSVMGYVLSVTKDSDSRYEKVINIKGNLLSFILTKKVMYKVQNFSGKTHAVAKAMIENNCIHNVYKPQTNLPRTEVILSPNMDTQTTDVKVQQTGGSIWQGIQPLLEQDSLGLEMYPVLTERKRIEGTETNVEKFYIKIFLGADRRRKNSEGNKPVIFSQSYSNIQRSSYEVDKSDYYNFAYIAGEGEGVDRIWEEVDSESKSGFLRFELFVDARDLQSQTLEGVTISTEEYKQLLKQRGIDNLNEHIVCSGYDATVINKKYIYEKDFYKGDFVTIIDNEIGAVIDAQITEVTRSWQGVEEIVDISVGYKKIQIMHKYAKKGVI